MLVHLPKHASWLNTSRSSHAMSWTGFDGEWDPWNVPVQLTAWFGRWAELAS